MKISFYLSILKPESIKHVILDCDYQIVRDLIVHHVNDIYMGRRNYHFLLSSLIFDFIIQHGHETPELFAVNITGVKILDLDFLNETKYSFSNSRVTILESNGSNRLSKNVTVRKLNKVEINKLTSILLSLAKVRSNNSTETNSQVYRLQQRSSNNNSKSSPPHFSIQDISVIIRASNSIT